MSATAEVMWPPPVPTVWFRTVAVPGTVQPVLAVVRSDQYETTVLPGLVTVTAGVVRATLLAVSKAIWWAVMPDAPR